MSVPTAIRPLTISRLARDLASRAGRPMPALRCYESLAALWIRCRDTGQPGAKALHEATCLAARRLADGEDTLLAPAAGRLPHWLRSDRSIVRLPASLAVQGVEWRDATALAQTWLDTRPGSGPVLVAGVRTGGAYLAPLVAAHLEAAGVDVEVIGVRPGEHHEAGHRRVLLVDDPPLTCRTLLALARELPGAEVLVPVFDTDDVQRLRQAGIAVTVLPREKWQSTRRLEPDALSTYLQAHAEWPGADRPLVLEALVPGRENSALAPWPGVRRRSPARAAVRLRTPGGIRHTGVAAWVPPGIFGDAARAAATALRSPLVPLTLAVAPALVVSEDLTPTAPLGPQPGPGRLEEAMDYVLARAGQLPVEPAAPGGPIPAVLLAVAEALTGTDGTGPATLLHDLLSVLPAALPDNRCEAEKWCLDQAGRLRKTGHLAHAYRRDNELLNPLIDLAALTVTFGSTLDAVAESLARRLPDEQPWHAALAVALLCHGTARGKQLPRTYNAHRAAETAREAYRLQRAMSKAAALLQHILNDTSAAARATVPVVHRWARPPAALMQPRLPFGGTAAPQARPGPTGEETQLTLKAVERWAQGRFQPVREGDVLLLAPLGAPPAWPQARAELQELPRLLPRPGLLAWCGVPVVSLGEVR
ncbi:phosphoribosyltransferase [Kitasatospora sp. NBC_00240]|uniref:phosphoribosyltransferase n=1 Tax=Kitasatospora sp. NBC_00240 TaxID=2903567 RepID=UPI002253AA87|nr:phosphoribosyltransferase [Kitasatospora sp. NBC_00240]MCX5215781.1 phosphoribosyltransferase [Kitasatospora sp. NBC_00240]